MSSLHILHHFTHSGISHILYVPPIPQQIQISVDQPYAGPAASCCGIIGTHSILDKRLPKKFNKKVEKITKVVLKQLKKHQTTKGRGGEGRGGVGEGKNCRGRQYHFFCDIISYQYHGQKSDIISCIISFEKI
jgi:hypothetical protein